MSEEFREGAVSQNSIQASDLDRVPIEVFNVAGRYKAIQIAMFIAGLVVLVSQLYLGFGTAEGFPPSISHSYHTLMGDVVFGCLLAVGIFLLAYQSPTDYSKSVNLLFLSVRLHQGWNFWFSTLAGLGAIGVALLPVDPRAAEECLLIARSEVVNDCVSGFTNHAGDADNPNLWHFVSAAAFFVSIALLCIFVFPKDQKLFKYIPADEEAGAKAVVTIYIPIYQLCGIFILGMIALLRLDSGQSVTIVGEEIKLFFLWEWLAVLAFTIAWGFKCRERLDTKKLATMAQSRMASSK